MVHSQYTAERYLLVKAYLLNNIYLVFLFQFANVRVPCQSPKFLPDIALIKPAVIVMEKDVVNPKSSFI